MTNRNDRHQAVILRLVRERDEARAEADRLRAELIRYKVRAGELGVGALLTVSTPAEARSETGE